MCKCAPYAFQIHGTTLLAAQTIARMTGVETWKAALAEWRPCVSGGTSSSPLLRIFLTGPSGELVEALHNREADLSSSASWMVAAFLRMG